MASNTLAAKLAKELRRNTKKTAILAVCCLVAVWFWFPLVCDWLGIEGEKTESTVELEEPNQPVVAQNSASQASVAAALPAEISWKNLTNLFKEHHLMTTAELRRHDLSPFGRSNREDVTTDKNQEDESGQETETSKSPEVQRPTLKELGLELTSTATGGGMQLAVINGKTCEVDSVLVIPYRDMEIELKLVEVRPDVVALSDGKEVQLLARNDTETRMQLGAAMTMHSIPGLATPDRILIDSGRTD